MKASFSSINFYEKTDSGEYNNTFLKRNVGDRWQVFDGKLDTWVDVTKEQVTELEQRFFEDISIKRYDKKPQNLWGRSFFNKILPKTS